VFHGISRPSQCAAAAASAQGGVIYSATNRAGVVAAIGFSCTPTLLAIAPTLRNASMPLISFEVGDSAFSDASAYPFVLRNVLSESLMGTAMANLAISYSWTRIGVLHQVPSYGRSASAIRDGYLALQSRLGARFFASAPITADAANISAQLQIFANNSVGVICFFIDDVSMHTAVTNALFASNMYGSGYVFLLSDFFYSTELLSSSTNFAVYLGSLVFRYSVRHLFDSVCLVHIQYATLQAGIDHMVHQHPQC
jgi:hypothetical protein